MFQLKVMLTMSLQLILQRIRFFIKEVNTLIFRYYFLREQVGKNMIKLEYCISKYQIADIFTKPLKINVFIKLKDLLGTGRLFQIRIKGGIWLLIQILLLLILILLPLNYFTIIIALIVSLQAC